MERRVDFRGYKLQTDSFGPVGFFVEVELEYPAYLHASHNHLKLAPEKLAIKKDWLSEYANSFYLPVSPVTKPIETLFDKHFYIDHFRNLKFCLEQGLKVTKLHRVQQFVQSC